MTNKQLLRWSNDRLREPSFWDSLTFDLFRFGHFDPDWWQYNQRIHPERQIKISTVRGSESEIIAKKFFAEISRDTELLVKRVNLLYKWACQKKSLPRLPKRSLHLDWPV